MISVIMPCHSYGKMLDITLPLWLGQECSQEFEVVIAKGPAIKLPQDPRIHSIDLEHGWFFCQSYNKLLAKARGDIILITQCDMQVNSRNQLERMAAHCHDNQMVSERYFKDGVRQAGIYLNCLMVEKQALVKAGGWCELYDNREAVAHEDSDLMATLLEQGLNLKLLETPESEGVYHINHPRPDYHGDPVLAARVAKGFEIYKSRHKDGVMALYVKQFARNLTMRRMEIENARV